MDAHNITGKAQISFERYGSNFQSNYLQYKLKFWECITAGILIGGLLAKLIDIRVPEKLLFVLGIIAIAIATHYARLVVCQKKWTTITIDQKVSIQIHPETHEVLWTGELMEQGQFTLSFFSSKFCIYPKKSELGSGYVLIGKAHKSFLKFASRNIAAAENERYYKIRNVELFIIPDTHDDALTMTLLSRLYQQQRKKVCA